MSRSMRKAWSKNKGRTPSSCNQISLDFRMKLTRGKEIKSLIQFSASKIIKTSSRKVSGAILLTSSAAPTMRANKKKWVWQVHYIVCNLNVALAITICLRGFHLARIQENKIWTTTSRAYVKRGDLLGNPSKSPRGSGSKFLTYLITKRRRTPTWWTISSQLV